jgi:ribonuclease G
LRLRDIGGIIIIDFIDMDDKNNLHKLYDYMLQQMKIDRAKHNILPLSKFCLMQITRHRVRPALAINTNETCPSCFGTGKTKPSIFFTNQLEEKIEKIVNAMRIKKFAICVHPYVAAYINQGIFSSLKRQWKRKYSSGLRVIPMQELGFLQYKFINRKREEIDLSILEDDAVSEKLHKI